MERKKNAEGGAFAKFAVHLDFPAMRFDDHFALEHADADALLFGRLKWAKERTLDKFGRHAAAVVGHGQNHTTVALTGFDANLTVRADGFPSVEKQVGKDVLDLGGVEADFGY